MADLDVQINDKIKQLSAKSAGQRAEAAYWLGEVGAEKAITKLVQLYKNDPDKKVRDAARYSLGMFKAVEDALARKDDEKVVALLTKVVEEGKLGRRQAIPTRTLVKVEGGLLVLFVVLMALSFILPGMRGAGGTRPERTEEPTAVARPADKDHATLVAELRFLWTGLSNDTGSLERELAKLGQGAGLDCTAFFNNPLPYEMSAGSTSAYPELAAIMTTLNTAQADLASVKLYFDQICSGAVTPSPEETSARQTLLTKTVQALASAEQALLNASTNATQTAAPNVTQVLETPTLEPGITPSASATPIDARPHLVALYQLVDNTRAQRGPYGLLNQYWTDVRNTGTTTGCAQPAPPIPVDYELPAEVAALIPELGQAADQVNIGLASLRDGWTQFTAACINNTLTGAASAGTQLTALAGTAFDNAYLLLDAARAKM